MALYLKKKFKIDTFQVCVKSKHIFKAKLVFYGDGGVLL